MSNTVKKYPRGEDHLMSIFSKDQVIEMRRMHEKQHMRCCDIARAFGAKHSTVYAILKYKSWQHVGPKPEQIQKSCNAADIFSRWAGIGVGYVAVPTAPTFERK